MFNNEIRLQRYKIKTKKSIYNRHFREKITKFTNKYVFLVVKTEDNRRYIGLVATRNKIIKLLHESTKKGDPAGISFKLYILLLCVFDIVFALLLQGTYQSPIS